MKFIKILNEGLGNFPDNAQENLSQSDDKYADKLRDEARNNPTLRKKIQKELEKNLNKPEYKNLKDEIDNASDENEKQNIYDREINTSIDALIDTSSLYGSEFDEIISNAKKEYFKDPSFVNALKSSLKAVPNLFKTLVNKLKPNGEIKKGTNSIKEKRDLVRSQIEDWDKNKLTKNFQGFLEAYIIDNGWNKRDPFLQWLQETDNNNIKALDYSSAETLAGLLEDKKLKFNNKYIIEADNNLFVGSSNDISYKLNVLSILLNPKEADKYKNDKGKTPNISLIYIKDKFLDTNEMKTLLDGFIDNSDEDNNNDNTIDFITWAHTKGKVAEGKEFTTLRDKLKAQKGKWKENALIALSDLRKLINTKDKYRLKNLGSVQVKPNHDWGHVQNIMINALIGKDYDVQKGINILYALAAHMSDFSIENLESNPTSCVKPIMTLFKNDNNFNINEKTLTDIVLDKNKFKLLNNLIIKDMQIKTIKDALKKFIQKYSQNGNSNDTTTTATTTTS